MTVEDNIIPELVSELAESSGYMKRRAEIAAFNAENAWIKRGLALVPIKFGISFTLTHMNQAGALVHVYTDGSVMLNHGGTEMGQGLYMKVAQVVATEFGLGVDRVKITATTTAKVPNSSPTAASSGSDLNARRAGGGHHDPRTDGRRRGQRTGCDAGGNRLLGRHGAWRREVADVRGGRETHASPRVQLSAAVITRRRSCTTTPRRIAAARSFISPMARR